MLHSKWYRGTCGQKWAHHWLRKSESCEISEGILGKESHWSHQDQILQELHELGQWPTPPSYLEPHLGPNLEISNLFYLFHNIIHLQANNKIFSLHNVIHHFIWCHLSFYKANHLSIRSHLVLCRWQRPSSRNILHYRFELLLRVLLGSNFAVQFYIIAIE